MHQDRDNGTVVVTVERRKGKAITSQDQREEIIEMEDTGKASVGVGLGMTINLGNYQSAKVDVHVTLPSDPDSLEETYDKAAEFCKAHIKKEVAAIKSKG